MSSFRLVGLDPKSFEPLFALPDDALAAIGAERRVATAKPGFPCRVSLEDADEGEELLLLPYLHQPGASPYRASGPIFVRRGATRRVMAADVVPSYVSSRLISVRAYDARHLMVDAAVCEGTAVAAEIERMFEDRAIAYVHLHNAKRGCFSCEVIRAGDD